MAYIVTQDDLNLLRQSKRINRIKVELLNKNLKVIDSIEGLIIDDEFSCTNDSVQRRTYHCDLVIKDSSFFIGKDKKIWLDKRLRVYYGIKSIRSQEIKWYRIGTFLYVDMTYRISSTERTLSLSCADMMVEYDGTLNGQIGGYGSSNTSSANIAQGLTIPAGEDIRSSIIALLKDAQITNYIVEDIGKEIPYDLEFSTGVTYCEVWTKICELYDSWEFFFDVDGNFVWQEIPNCADSPVVLDDNVIRKILVDESINTSFSGIYNVTEVWGKVLELDSDDRYASSSTYTNNTYNVTFDYYTSWDSIDHLTQIGVFIYSGNQDSPKFSINGYPPIPIYDGDGKPLKAGALKANTAYVFRYRRLTINEGGISSALFLLGQYQCYGKYVENSDEYPFSVKNLGYEILQSVDYSGLSDDAACYNQAEYLTYKTTAMMDTVTLTIPVIPWLDVNTKIRYTPQNGDKTNQYIVKNFSWQTGSETMTLTLYKFMEGFSFVYNRRNQN